GEGGDGGGRRCVPAPAGASAVAHRRAEYRHDEPCRLLPELPVQLDEGSGRRQGRAHDQGREPPGDLRHAVRGLEGEVPEGRRRGEARHVRKSKAETLIVHRRGTLAVDERPTLVDEGGARLTATPDPRSFLRERDVRERKE